MSEAATTILLTPKGAINKSDKQKLGKVGYIVIEVDDPEQIKTIGHLGMIGSDVISSAAIETLNFNGTADSTKSRFATIILSKTMARLISNKPKP